MSLLPFKSVLIYGMGMMGSSLSLSLKKSDQFSGRIDGIVRSDKSAAFIKEHSICDSVYVAAKTDDLKKIDLKSYDLIVIGLPVKTAIELADKLPEFSGIVTDMSSTRREIDSAFAKRSDLRFIGSHPMCGSEDAGPESARPDLFFKRLCIVSENSLLPEELESVRMLWAAVGMNTYIMSSADQDSVLSYLSHGPHILSGLISIWADGSEAVARHNSKSPLPLSGGGFRDMVRISGSNPSMWKDILSTNKDCIVDSLKEYRNILDELISEMHTKTNEEWENWFRDARRKRNILCGYEEDS